MSAPLHAIKVLEVHDVKIYEVKDQKLSVKTRGKLELIYLPEVDRFFLNLNSFRYILSPNIFIMASVYEKRAYRSYFLPGVKSHYILKLKTPPTAAVLGNLETIFVSYSHLTYKSDEQKQLEDQMKSTQAHARKASTDYASSVGSYITKGGEGFKQNMFKFANYLGKGFQKKNSNPVPQNQNQLYVKNIDELKSINDPENQCIDLDRTKVMKVLELSNQIGQEQQQQQQIDPNAKNGGWADLKKGTVTGLKSLWAGLDEATTIFGSAMTKKKKDKKDKKDKKKDKDLMKSPNNQSQSVNDDSSTSGGFIDASGDLSNDSILYAPPVPQDNQTPYYHQPQEYHNGYSSPPSHGYNHIQHSPYQNMPQQMPYGSPQQMHYNNAPQQQIPYSNHQYQPYNQQQQIPFNNNIQPQPQPQMNPQYPEVQNNLQSNGQNGYLSQIEVAESQYFYREEQQQQNHNNNAQHQPVIKEEAKPHGHHQQSVYFADTSMHIQGVYPSLHSVHPEQRAKMQN